MKSAHPASRLHDEDRHLVAAVDEPVREEGDHGEDEGEAQGVEVDLEACVLKAWELELPFGLALARGWWRRLGAAWALVDCHSRGGSPPERVKIA